MDGSLYDEFGNYIGPGIESDEESEEDAEEAQELPAAGGSNGWPTSTDDDVDMDNRIVLAEDKKYYPEAGEVYGEEVEAVVMDEDEMPLEQPIIKPVKKLEFELGAKDSTTYVPTDPFLFGLMSNPSLIRNVALVGHLHHGKNLFMDMLVEQAHHRSVNFWI